jgi:hypothetical protein
MSTSETDLAWAAGFFDGEGHCRWNICTNKKWHSGQCKMDMAQTKSPELLEKFLKAVGVGSIVGPYGPYQKKHHSPAWYWRCSGDDVVTTYTKLKPYLGTVKRQQIEDALETKRKFYE